MRRLALIAALLLIPGLAAAQDVPVTTAPAPNVDAIGDLIARQGGAEIDEETAETMVVPPAGAEPPPVATTIPPPTPAAPIPYVPAYARPTPSGLDRPVMLHETGISPDGPPDAAELTYESRVRGSIAAAQGLQGPLDGAWTLTDAAGGKLYAFQMVDPGRGLGDLEGAWRDLRRGDAMGGVGLIAAVERGENGALTVRFYPRDLGDPVVVELVPTASGGWTGALNDKGAATPVTLVRDGPAPASYATLGQPSSGYAPRPYDSRIYAPASLKKKAVKAKGKKGKATAKKKAPAKKKVVKKKR